MKPKFIPLINECKRAGLLRKDFDLKRHIHERFPDHIFRIAAAAAVRDGVFKHFRLILKLHKVLNDPELYQF